MRLSPPPLPVHAEGVYNIPSDPQTALGRKEKAPTNEEEARGKRKEKREGKGGLGREVVSPCLSESGCPPLAGDRYSNK